MFCLLKRINSTVGKCCFVKVSTYIRVSVFRFVKVSLCVLLAGIVMILSNASINASAEAGVITIFLCGDVMTGRGIDQVLPHAGDPTLHESYVKDARIYVQLAEKVNGVVKQPVDWLYIWGDAIDEMNRLAPDVRIINLETSITRGDEYWRYKGIHYRMHPLNVPVISAAKIDVCTLANNHVLDWGYSGLLETLKVLNQAGILGAGAGRNLAEAESPVVYPIKNKGRVIIFSCGLEDSGIPEEWAASAGKPGVFLLRDLSDKTVEVIKRNVDRIKRQGDIVLVSIHWGGNWGYDIPEAHRRFAHELIDEAGVDMIHGHSSHHPKGIEIYKNKPIIYGCGDFLNDYEGIGGHEQYRPDLSLMYFVSIDTRSGNLVRFRMTPMRMQRLKVNRASHADALWLKEMLEREGGMLGTRVELNDDNTLALQ